MIRFPHNPPIDDPDYMNSDYLEDFHLMDNVYVYAAVNRQWNGDGTCRIDLITLKSEIGEIEIERRGFTDYDLEKIEELVLEKYQNRKQRNGRII